MAALLIISYDVSDPERYAEYWRWPTASKLLQEAERIGFDHQVQYGMWGGYGGETRWNEDGLDFATAPANSGRSKMKLSTEWV